MVLILSEEWGAERGSVLYLVIGPNLTKVSRITVGELIPSYLGDQDGRNSGSLYLVWRRVSWLYWSAAYTLCGTCRTSGGGHWTHAWIAPPKSCASQCDLRSDHQFLEGCVRGTLGTRVRSRHPRRKDPRKMRINWNNSYHKMHKNIG